MKSTLPLSLVLSLLLALAFSVSLAGAEALNWPTELPASTMAVTQAPKLQQDTPTPTQPLPTATDIPPTPTPTDLPPTATATDLPPTPTPTATTPSQPGFFRPVIVMASYSARPKTITPGGSLKVDFSLTNQGQVPATNIIITFSAGELLPSQNGGVVAAGRLEPGETRSYSQAFTASSTLTGLGAVSVQIAINYTDESGAAYAESLSVAVNSSLPPATSPPSGPARPTPTPTSATQAQLVIQDTRTDVAILQPGTRFTLELSVANVGNAAARRVTMIAGGGSLPPDDPNDPNGPSTPGGIPGSGGEFTNFSPLGASNVQALGDIPAGSSLAARQPLIVNVTTNPGAYSFKISFVYTDEKGVRHIDDQVITLLVYLQPVVEVSFYRDPGPLFAGQPNILPIQIINLGRKSVILGNMRVSAPGGQLMNNTLLVGPLEAGGYFTLDASLVPDLPGPLELVVTVDYNDDFNQPQTITRTIPVEILEAPIFEEPPVEGGGDPGMGIPPEIQGETLWQKVLRFLRGLLGLDSGVPQPEAPGEFPAEQPPLDGSPSLPAPSGPKG